ncbi:MAG: hypothetical protein KZQ88_14460 [Candidatus Thiodiazotropha sp. (ex Dulcina madagascariensis)]|nr:hypothetical protein [Candidatus Thiodiazotropha sp. (ex Dulcina madagascariensis)]MCU7927931.1 hypothetical protein [Candidatus Thiodiazotropha sp. (ex Dulcina madagascariensis)]
MQRQTIITVLAGSILIAACIKEDVVKTAQEKKLVVAGQPLKFGGSYNVTRHSLEMTINGDPVIKEKFSDLNPAQNLNADYEGLRITSKCYFSSVLSKKGGFLEVASRKVQSEKGRTGDECTILIDGKMAEKLYF